MARLKVLSGTELVTVFGSFDFQRHSQKGSHLKMRRVGPRGAKETLTIPLHAEIDRGTVAAIYRQALRYLTEKELRPHFDLE